MKNNKLFYFEQFCYQWSFLTSNLSSIRSENWKKKREKVKELIDDGKTNWCRYINAFIEIKGLCMQNTTKGLGVLPKNKTKGLGEKFEGSEIKKVA